MRKNRGFTQILCKMIEDCDTLWYYQQYKAQFDNNVIVSRNNKCFEVIMMDYPNELIGGELVPPLVIRGTYVINDEHKGTVYVEAGELNVEGQLNGTLHVKEDSEVEISGAQIGTVYIGADATVTVTGELIGTANLEQGSLLVVEQSGRIEGTIFNNGCVVLRGAFGGIVNGDGEVKVEGGGQIKKPVLRDGLIYFK